jgi:putative transposase
VVHLIRHSLEFVSWKDRKPVVPALRMIYRAKDADAGKAQAWRRNWDRVIPFFAFPEAVRRIIYTTDEMDKPFVSRCASFRLRGRPRGEERGVGWKLRQAA